MRILQCPRPRRVAMGVRSLVIGSVLPFTVGSHSATAQTSVHPENPIPVTRLGELYAQLQRDNPKIAAARAFARAAAARVPGVTRPPDPVLQLGYMNYSLPSLAPMPTLGMRQLQLMQMLPLGGKLALAGRVAGAQASATNQRAVEIAWGVRAAIAMDFYDLYATDRGLDVARETLRLLQDIEKTAEGQHQNFARLTLLGETISEFVNQMPIPGLMFSWGPSGSGAIAYTDREFGHLTLLDQRKHKHTVSGVKDALLPAWSTDGTRLAWVQKSGRKKYTLVWAAVSKG